MFYKSFVKIRLLVFMMTWLTILNGVITGNQLSQSTQSAQSKHSSQSTPSDQSTQSAQYIQVSEDTYFVYEKPGFSDFIVNFPSGMQEYFTRTFKWENWKGFTAVILSTGLLIYYDQLLIDKAQVLGRKLDISTDASTSYFNDKGFAFKGPYDLGSSMYFIGDGWTQVTVALSFLVSGAIKQDNRLLQIASQLFEGFLTVGFSVQLLKHTTGRESPFVASVDRGKWRPFPSIKTYHDSVSTYDAYPSGHVAVTFHTITVIAENLPEYTFIRPLGYTLLGLLSFQMLNNGVHWASDYPLSIALGYTFANIAIDHGRKVVKKSDIKVSIMLRKKKISDSLSFLPILSHNYIGLRLGFNF